MAASGAGRRSRSCRTCPAARLGGRCCTVLGGLATPPPTFSSSCTPRRPRTTNTRSRRSRRSSMSCCAPLEQQPGAVSALPGHRLAMGGGSLPAVGRRSGRGGGDAAFDRGLDRRFRRPARCRAAVLQAAAQGPGQATGRRQRLRAARCEGPTVDRNGRRGLPGPLVAAQVRSSAAGAGGACRSWGRPGSTRPSRS